MRKINTAIQNKDLQIVNKKRISVQVTHNTWLQFDPETDPAEIEKRVDVWKGKYHFDVNRLYGMAAAQAK